MLKMEIIFTRTEYLIFLFLVPLIILIHFVSIKIKKKQALKFANFDALARIKGIDIYSKNITILVLSCFVVILIILSLAGAVVKVEKSVSSFSFVLAIDSSKSMEATDMSSNRMDAAKKTSVLFVGNAPVETKIGVVSFSGSALIEQTVVSDKSLIKGAINDIKITSIGGTDITEAVVTGVNLLVGEENGAVIILSDGQINTGKVDYAIDYASENNVVVNTIAIGTAEGGNTSYGFSKMDENSLRAISLGTKGRFAAASNEDELKKAFEDMILLKTGRASVDISRYLLIVALILFFVEYGLINTKNRIFP